MRRLMLTATASALVLAIAPASALAQRHHHKRHHKRVHHTRVRHMRFGDVNSAPSTTPTSPTTPTTPPSNTIGTITDNTNGTLQITLTNGTVLSGMVTNDTEVECESSTTQTMQTNDGGGDNQGSSSGHDQGSGDDDGQGDDDANENQNNQACPSAANLQTTTNVTGAELKISSDGAVWEKINVSL